MRSFKFANDIAFMGQKILVVVLVGIEAEIAIPRTAQVDKKCRCSLPLSTGQACRRNPAAPQGAFAIFTMARTRRGNFGATRSRTRFRNLERNAEGGDSMFVVAFDLVECPVRTRGRPSNPPTCQCGQSANRAARRQHGQPPLRLAQTRHNIRAYPFRLHYWQKHRSKSAREMPGNLLSLAVPERIPHRGRRRSNRRHARPI